MPGSVSVLGLWGGPQGDLTVVAKTAAPLQLNPQTLSFSLEIERTLSLELEKERTMSLDEEDN